MKDERILNVRCDNGKQQRFYVEFEVLPGVVPRIVAVRVPGDLMEVTDKMSVRETLLIQRQLNRRFWTRSWR